jgi:hypothetical protein
MIRHAISYPTLLPLDSGIVGLLTLPTRSQANGIVSDHQYDSSPEPFLTITTFYCFDFLLTLKMQQQRREPLSLCRHQQCHKTCSRQRSSLAFTVTRS